MKSVSSVPYSSSSSSSIKAYAELLRLSNAPTAVADVWMGMLVAMAAVVTVRPLTVREAVGAALVTLASCLLYLAGMVLNDVFDAEEDAVLRPTRPIPRGDVAWKTAGGLGWGMLIGGVSLAAAGGLCFQSRNPALVAMLLAACVIAYNAGLKRTLVGPLAMGACRGLNGLLGMSVMFRQVTPMVGVVIFLGTTTYIIGVTLFAMSEEVESDRRKLSAATLVAFVGLGVLSGGVWFATHGRLGVVPLGWALLWMVIALYSGRRFAAAIAQPSPRRVQGAVGNAIQSIILIDTALACGFAGPFWGLAVLALLPPTMLMSRFIPQT